MPPRALNPEDQRFVDNEIAAALANGSNARVTAMRELRLVANGPLYDAVRPDIAAACEVAHGAIEAMPDDPLPTSTHTPTAVRRILTSALNDAGMGARDRQELVRLLENRYRPIRGEIDRLTARQERNSDGDNRARRRSAGR